MIDIKKRLKLVSEIFLEKLKEKEVQIISHFDTDGITSAAIMIKTLNSLDCRFSLKIVKNLEKDLIMRLPKDKIILFLDLASNSLNHIIEAELTDVFIIDHHEIDEEPPGIEIINPQFYNKEKISSSGLTYLFCKEILPEIKEMAKIAVIGMIGDRLEKDIGPLNKEILGESNIKRKRGLLVFPSTRPINKVLEFSSNPYIPGITGNPEGVLELLRETGLKTDSKGVYKSILEIKDEEMKKLITSIILRNPKAKDEEIVGDIFLINLYNRIEDARELSARINACSRLGESSTALGICLENPDYKKKSESKHLEYKRNIITSLKIIDELENYKGENFFILNAKRKIKDTIIGTISSILSSSPNFKEGTVIIGMAHYKNKIKISARMVGKNHRNLKKILQEAIQTVGGEVGGHQFAAGAIINQKKEKEFIEILKHNLEFEKISVK